jgi:gamma-glutamyltranspeptidase/glutathione hydrolase
MKLSDVLAPAIELAENGFPVSPISAEFWERESYLLKKYPHANEMLIDGRAPKVCSVNFGDYIALRIELIFEGGRDHEDALSRTHIP